MLLTYWNRAVTVWLVAGATAMMVAVLMPPVLAQTRAVFAAPGDAPKATQPEALPQSPSDKEEQAQQAIQAAEARFREAEAQLQAARANYERAKTVKNAVAGRALRQQLQSFNWLFLEANVTQMTIRVTSTDSRRGGLRLGEQVDSLSLELRLAKDVKVFIDGGEGKVTDLGIWMQVSVRLAEDYPEVTRIDATSKKGGPDQILKAVDPAKSTISVTVGGKVTLEGIPIEGATIKISPDYEDRDRSLEDLRPGMRVSLDLSVKDGLIVVKRIRARK